MNEINTEIREAIEKNLPSLVATELKDYIQQAENNKTRLAERDAKIVELQSELTSYKKANVELGVTLNDVRALNKEYGTREAAIKDAETKILVATMKQQAAEAVTMALQATVNAVFANRTFNYTEQIFRSVNKNLPNPSYGGTESGSETETRTVTR